jgi:uncharacterized protein YjgD (DUF1641 family)
VKCALFVTNEGKPLNEAILKPAPLLPNAPSQFMKEKTFATLSKVMVTSNFLTALDGTPAITPYLEKLKKAFSWGCKDEEACNVAGIPHKSYKAWEKEHPEFKTQKEQLQLNPIAVARETLLAGLGEDPDLALKYLERVKRDEFSLRTEKEETKVSVMQVVMPAGYQGVGLLKDAKVQALPESEAVA